MFIRVHRTLLSMRLEATARTVLALAELEFGFLCFVLRNVARLLPGLLFFTHMAVELGAARLVVFNLQGVKLCMTEFASATCRRAKI